MRRLKVIDVEFWIEVVILKLVTWMNRLDIWINNSNNSALEYRPLKAELLLRQTASCQIAMSQKFACVVYKEKW